MKPSCLLLFLFVSIIPLNAQRFMHLTSNDGLTDNHARFVYQDSNGYIFVGTRNGLSRYDGYKFSQASVEDSLGFIPREFSAMTESADGYFVVASSGIYQYNSQENKLLLSHKLNLLDEACFMQFEGRIYCGNSAGLFYYNKEGKQWLKCNQYVSGMDNIHVRTMLINSRSEFILGTSKGLFRYGSGMKLLESDIGNDERFHNINGLVEDNKGGIWVSTISNLFYKDSETNSRKEYYNIFSDKHIRCLESDASGRLWVGGEFGIIIIDPEKENFIELYRDISHSQGLNDNAVYSLFRDQAKNIWVGTYFGGINLWSSTFDKFTIYFPGSGVKNLSGKVVREMQEDESGNIWLALEDGGLNYLNPVTGKIKRFFIQKENEYKNVHSIILNNDTLWVGSFNMGLECYKIEKRNEEPYLIRISSYLEEKMIFAISQNSSNKIFAGSAGAIYILDIPSNEIKTFSPEIFENRIVYTLKCISDNEFLAGTLRNGLYYCDFSKGISSAIIKDEHKRNLQTISSIKKIDSSQYSITSSAGLHIFNQNDKSLKNLLESENDVEFRSCIKDDHDGYWISSTNGLYYLNLLNGKIKKYNIYDGLPENQFNFNSSFLSTNGKMFFGTYNGLISFIPEKLKTYNDNIPGVNFTAYTVLSDDRKTLTSKYFDNNTTELKLKPFQTFLSLEFSTLGYTRTRDMEYEIRLIGESVNWDQIKNSRSVTFTKLSKGRHQVEVRSVNEENRPGPSTILNIYRQPAIWQTKYAYAIYLILTILLAQFIRKDFFRRQKEKNALAMERLEKEQQKKINDQKMQFFLNISHEFRTPLTIIAGTIDNIINKFNLEDKLKLKLYTIQNTSDNLNKLVNDFLDYGKLNSGYKAIEMKREPVLPFVEKASNMFDNWAETNRLSYEKIIEKGNEPGFFDPHKLERVIYNLLSNAFKFNKSNGKVIFKAYIKKEDRSWLYIEVIDNGPGIPVNILRALKKRFESINDSSHAEKGIGLSYTAGLVNQMSGKIEVESNKKSGTRFKVKIPIVFLEYHPVLELSENVQDINNYQESQKEEIMAMIKPEKKSSIMVIDDNIELLQMLEESLEEKYNLTTVSRPKESLNLVLQKDYSLIICDIMMPEMHGFEVIESLQSNILTSHIPVLILTAAAEKKIELKGYRKGAISYLAKPFKVEELLIKIESIISFRKQLINRFRNEYSLNPIELACTDKDKSFLEKAIGVVHKHIENTEFDVELFCSEMNISRTLLHTKLKNITDMSATEFIRNIRLKQAYVYLKKGELPVSEISFKCGFNDANYFSRCFKKVYNIHPSKIKSS